ncbi:MAG: NTP transferase domain-containing protein [Candidatus Omnitrophica bacterium]|nr:NTP transferase domain-containing protein [Candidatus Omnitrophota bacterium]
MITLSGVILAAGKGKRLNTPSPKALTLLQGRPLIYYILKQLSSLRRYIKQIIIVIGYKGDVVKKEVEKILKEKEVYFDKNDICFVYQEKLLGTADALKCAKPKIKYENIFVACADTPLITKPTLFNFFSYYAKNNAICCLLTAKANKLTDLGQIIRDDDDCVMAIKEKIDRSQLDMREKLIEVNSGFYLFNRDVLFSNIDKIPLHPQKKEYFLTDIVEIFYKEGFKIFSYVTDDYNEIFGINTQFDLLYAEKILRERILNDLILKGVKILDPQTTFIDKTARIGKNTIIYPFTFIEKNVIIGNSCVVGPFIHLRQNIRIADNTYLGNFVEIVRSKIGKNVKCKHFSYLGDVTVKDNVNIGAGTVVANFDGKKKNKTLIGKGAFIGSDTILVAPIIVGKGAITGAGSVVTKNVKAKTVVVGVPAKILRKG